MLFPRPSDDDLFSALMARDETFDGVVFVGVSTTGIFCRLSCPARKPRRENCTFLPTVAACLEAGFRPCRRCSPLSPPASAAPLVRQLLEAFDARPEHRWRECDLRELGMDPSNVRRAFKRHFGLTFLEMARLRRLRRGAQTLADGGAVIDAQLEAGFDSGSGFRHALARVMGRPPSALDERAGLLATWIDTPLGPMIAVGDRVSLRLLEFFDRRALPTELKQLRAVANSDIGVGPGQATDQIRAELDAYFRGEASQFQTPVYQRGSSLDREVWTALRQLPPGQTVSYAWLADRIGRPSAVRAVARANGRNALAIHTPCHRVIGSDGDLTGYGGGIWRKRWLLHHERSHWPSTQSGRGAVGL